MNRVKELISENRLCIAAFFLPVLIVVLAFAVTGIYPFGRNQIAVIDMYHQFVPFLSQLQDKLQHMDSLFYSWDGAGGFNFWNLLSYYGASPLNLLLIFFPAKHVMEGVTVILLVKIGLAGSFMYLFLSKGLMGRLNREPDMTAVAFSTLYALCSYVTAYYWCIMWIDAVALLPLIMLGLHRVIDGESPVMYVVSLALTVFCNYYIAIEVCIFIACYYPFLYFMKSCDNRELESRSLCIKRTVRSVAYSLLGVVMASAMLLPTYLSMQNTYYIKSEMPESWTFYYDAIEIINQLLPDAQLTYLDGRPNLYCGLIVVMMLALYFSNGSFRLREKMLNLAFLGVMFMSFNVNKLNFIFHGFHFPNQLPYRYTFAVCFILVGIAYKTFLNFKSISVKQLWIVLAAGLGYYAIAQKLLGKVIEHDNEFFYVGAGLLILYSAVLIARKTKRINGRAAVIVLCLLIAGEMTWNVCDSFQQVGCSEHKAYMNNYADVKKLTKYVEDEGFCRMEMYELMNLNEPAQFHYRGLSQFSSSVNANTTKTMVALGLDGAPGKNRFTYDCTSPVTNAIFGVNYIVAKNSVMSDSDFDMVKKSGHSRLYASKYPMSIGYILPPSIRTLDISSDDAFENLNDFARAATDGKVRELFHELKFKNFNRTGKKGEEVYVADKTRKYYVQVKGASVAHVYVSREDSLKDLDIGDDTSGIVNIGEIKAGEKFTIKIEYESKDNGFHNSHVGYLDEDAWKKTYKAMSREQMEVTEVTDRSLKGTITTKGGVLVTSIPNEEGWKLKVDGRDRGLTEFVAENLIAIELGEGTHEIELKFTPPGFWAGIAITIASILVLIATRILSRRRAPELAESPDEDGDLA